MGGQIEGTALDCRRKLRNKFELTFYVATASPNDWSTGNIWVVYRGL